VRRPPLIAIEGIDGTGKGTQARLLLRYLQRRAYRTAFFSFPSYGKTIGGALVGAYLNGELGPPRQIDSRLAAVLFALDRFEMKSALERARARGALIVCDRYVASNLAHQAARTAPGKRRALRALIEKLEYGVFGLPRPDLAIYLDMPDGLAQERIRQKKARTYTKKELDAHEADRAHLRAALAEYRRQARRPGWITIRTVDRQHRPRSREEIHREIAAALERRIGRK
jgi:dTMP kinase